MLGCFNIIRLPVPDLPCLTCVAQIGFASRDRRPTVPRIP
jgi:hypothetical protein